LSDLDYSDYISDDAGGSLSPAEMAKRMVMGIGKKYINQAVGQPFEVAITNLQVRYMPKRRPKRTRNGIFNGGGRGGERGPKGAEGDDVRSS